MKLLYIHPIEKTNMNSGVNKKILNQLKSFRRFGYETWFTLIDNNIIFISNGNESIIIGHIKGNYSRQYDLYKSIINIKIVKFDIVYLRYPLTSINLILLLKKIRNKTGIILMEIPTYPYYKEAKTKNILIKFQYAIDYLLRKKLNKYINYVIMTTNKYTEFQRIKVINIDNSIDESDIAQFKGNKDTKTYNLLSVSTMSLWHGIDRIIESFNCFYEFVLANKIFLHIVGSGPEFSRLKKMVNPNLQKNIIFYNNLYGNELEKLYSISDVGISSLGLHRIGLKSASVLKTREYWAKGLPFIIGYDEESIKDNVSFPYILKVESDESIISVPQIIEFIDKNRNSLGQFNDMIKFAKNNLTWDTQILKIISFVNGGTHGIQQ